MTQNPLPGARRPEGFQVSVSSLTLGTLHEAILAFSSQDRFEAFWPAVCQNIRWLIPSRRMCVLLGAGERFEIAGQFEQGRFRLPEPAAYAPAKADLNTAFRKNSAQWFAGPRERFGAEGDALTAWLLRDSPALLFVLPMRAKGENIGALLFAMSSIAEADQAMLTTLGTLYALHAGMTYTLIRITEERRRMQDQLIVQERMASLGNLVAGVAHELNNPIGAVKSAMDVSGRCIAAIEEALAGSGKAEELGEDPKFRKVLGLLRENNQVIATACQRVTRLVQSLKNFARLDEAEFKRVDIHEGIDSTLALVHHELQDRIEVVKEYGALPPVSCYPDQLNQVFMNLFMNAIQAIEGRGFLWIRTSTDGTWVFIRVADTGRGIRPEHLDRIFDPGFTTKGVGVGTGLGLSISYNIVKKHRGAITARSEVGKGTEFTIALPVEQSGRPG